MRTNQLLLILTIPLAITACKIEVKVPEGGQVSTLSGSYSCTAGQTCEIDVVDLFFDETFTAIPESGYEFGGWRKEAKYFCGGRTSNCRLQTAGFEGNDVLTAFLESDAVFYLQPVFDKPDSWTSKAEMINEHSEFSGCSINGKLYAIGGRQGFVRTPSWSTSVEEYDPETDKWAVVSEVPTPRKHTTASALDGRCFVIGGQSKQFGTSGPAMATVESFDPATGEWERHADLITARYTAASAAIGGKLYVVGGHDNGALATLEVYDPHSDTWTQKASMSEPRGYLGAGAIDNKLYVVGGGVSYAAPPLDLVEEYDPAGDRWRTRAKMPKPKNFFGTAVLDGKLYAIGGWRGYQLWDDSTTVYDTATNSWRVLAGLPRPRVALVALSAGGKIYVLGGSNLSENVLILDEYTP